MFEVITAAPFVDQNRPDFESINILHFEALVKLYAHPANNGKVSVSQLRSAFEDHSIFASLGKSNSVTHKILTSPFFVNFVLSHNIKNTNYQEKMH